MTFILWLLPLAGMLAICTQEFIEDKMFENNHNSKKQQQYNNDDDDDDDNNKNYNRGNVRLLYDLLTYPNAILFCQSYVCGCQDSTISLSSSSDVTATGAENDSCTNHSSIRCYATTTTMVGMRHDSTNVGHHPYCDTVSRIPTPSCCTKNDPATTTQVYRAQFV
jgi:hypothetical protein